MRNNTNNTTQNKTLSNDAALNDYEIECLFAEDIRDCVSFVPEYCEDEANFVFNVYGDMG